MIFEQLRLNVTRDTYVFTPLYEPAKRASNTDISLTVHRDTGVLEINASASSQAVVQEFIVYGIIGFVQLQAGEYMIVITNQECVGNLRGYNIYRATMFQILPLPRNLNGLSDAQIDDEQRFAHLLEDHLRQNTFYHSYGYDLTQCFQRQTEMQKKDLRLAMWQTADSRFFWNRTLCEKLINAVESGLAAVNHFILPVIQGFVSISPLFVNGHWVTLGLLSRRSRERAGTRYFSRGLDESGHASNFVETEQIVSTEQHIMSFVQTRGSAPLIWGQITNTRYTPQLWIETETHVLETSRAHFNQQIQIYGPQILVNLVNKKGYEYPVGHAYASLIDQLADPRLHYVHFDFHHECRKMKWDRVQLLIDKLEPDLVQQGFCHYDASDPSNPTIRSVQSSVVRTNCMDCLDRTNVVQSALARWVLNRQLRRIGILGELEKIENDNAAMSVFNNVWADNADILSIAYSGTGALKTDYTRMGKRTYMGAFNDLVNSLIRYVKNNYMDGSRQDAIDLFLGNYMVELASFVSSQHHVSPFTDKRPLTVRLVPIVLITSFSAFLFALFFPELIGIESSTLYIFLLSLCFASTISSWRYIQQNGTAFVDWPSLKPLTIPRSAQRDYTADLKANGRTPHRVPERSNTATLDQVEQGYELPTLKKLT